MDREGGMTERQRDIFTIYCLLEGIRSETNIKKKLEEFLLIRQIIADICVEKANEQGKDAE